MKWNLNGWMLSHERNKIKIIKKMMLMKKMMMANHYKMIKIFWDLMLNNKIKIQNRTNKKKKKKLRVRIQLKKSIDQEWPLYFICNIKVDG